MTNFGRKKCTICGSKLIKKGFDKANNQIWYCKNCKKYHVFKRKDIQNKLWLYRYIEFLFNKKTIKDFGVSKSTFYRKISKFRNTNIFLPLDANKYNQLFIDALWIKRKCCYLIARNEEHVIGFGKYNSECYESWLDFLNKFNQPKYVVCDGQNGMIKAIKKIWPTTQIQNCIFHILMNGRQKLTKHPKTIQGGQLRKLSLRLSNIHSKSSVTRWGNDLYKFIETNRDYLLSKSSKDDEQWYTHKRVKSYAFQLLKAYDSGNLFRYVFENNFKLANTNNYLEGGINSPIRRLLHMHHGMKYENQMQLIELYLFRRSKVYNLSKLGELFET